MANVLVFGHQNPDNSAKTPICVTHGADQPM